MLANLSRLGTGRGTNVQDALSGEASSPERGLPLHRFRRVTLPES